MSCPACDLPRSITLSRYIFIWPPKGHIGRKINDHIVKSGLAVEDAGGPVLIACEDAVRTLICLGGVLTSYETEEVRVLLSTTRSPTIMEYGEVAPLNYLLKRLRGDWLIKLIEERRYFNYVQPIVSSREPGKSIGHEYLLRGRDQDGSLVVGGALFDSAVDRRILFNLDRAGRISAVETAARYKVPGKVFINFMPGSIYDPTVCLRTTVNAIRENDLDPDRVVFEIVETEQISDLAHLRGIVNYYREAGFRIALDDYGAGYNNLDTFIALKPDYIKFDKSLTSDVVEDLPKRALLRSMAERAKDFGIETIAEGIEDASAATVMADMGVDYLQGYFFGRPAEPSSLGFEVTL